MAPKLPLWCCVPQRPRSHRLRGISALLPLAGAGLAALLSIELVVTNAVLGNQVTPAEMVHALFICRENKKKKAVQTQAATHDNIFFIYFIYIFTVVYSVDNRCIK